MYGLNHVIYVGLDPNMISLKRSSFFMVLDRSSPGESHFPNTRWTTVRGIGCGNSTNLLTSRESASVAI